MGAVCGRESHFESLGGNGHTLGSAPPPPSAANAKKPAQAHSLASPGSRPSPGSSDAQKREAMLKAAEARSASATKRGAPSGGKLAAALAAQPQDGGRVQDAVTKGTKVDEPLVFD